MKKADADIDLLSADIRVGCEGFRNGQPWEIGVTLTNRMDGVAELRRIDKPLPLSAWHAIGRRLARAGFRVCQFLRKKDGREELHPVPLDRYHKELCDAALEKMRSRGLVPPDFTGDRCPCCDRHLYLDAD